MVTVFSQLEEDFLCTAGPLAASRSRAGSHCSREGEVCKKLYLKDLKAGHRVQADAGFTCIVPDAILDVKATDGGALFVVCADGKHFLEGQEEEDGSLVGFRLHQPPQG